MSSTRCIFDVMCLTTRRDYRHIEGSPAINHRIAARRYIEWRKPHIVKRKNGRWKSLLDFRCVSRREESSQNRLQNGRRFLLSDLTDGWNVILPVTRLKGGCGNGKEIRSQTENSVHQESQFQNELCGIQVFRICSQKIRLFFQ